jgi:hypothetical protein
MKKKAGLITTLGLVAALATSGCGSNRTSGERTALELEKEINLVAAHNATPGKYGLTVEEFRDLNDLEGVSTRDDGFGLYVDVTSSMEGKDPIYSFNGPKCRVKISPTMAKEMLPKFREYAPQAREAYLEANRD